MNKPKMTTKQIEAKLRRKGGKTAAEIGTSVSRMRLLENQGIVRESGRRAGKGRPPWSGIWSPSGEAGVRLPEQRTLDFN